MLKGRKVLVELLVGLLKALYLLPPLLALFILKIALAVLFFARAFFSLVSLPPTKVSSYFSELQKRKKLAPINFLTQKNSTKNGPKMT